MENRKFAASLVCAAVALFASAISFCRTPAYCGEAEPVGKKELVFFFSAGCHECQKVKSESLPRIAGAYGDRIYLTCLDIAEMGNFKRLFELARQMRPEGREVKVPAVYFQGVLLVGAGEINGKLEALVKTAPAGPGREPVPAGKGYEPVAHFQSFTPLAVGIAGLVDGVNPCAFTVIVFFISFLALQGFRRRELGVIGGFFIAGVFFTYLLIGLGIFGVFYTLSVFWWLRAAFNWLVGGLSILFAAAAFADCVRYKRTGKTDGMLLSLPQPVKNRIHAVIGMHYRGYSTPGGRSRTMAKLAATALVTGFLVSLLEAVCTGQMYLPTILFVMKSAPMKMTAFTYLVLYNLMFIVPLVTVLSLAVAGMNAGQFSRFMNRHFLAVKLSMAALFLSLGVFIFWRGR